MAKIEEILSVVQKRDHRGKLYYVTTALVDGDECSGWGNEYKVGEEVSKYYDRRYQRATMIKKDFRIDKVK